jgi:hypothetical protein
VSILVCLLGHIEEDIWRMNRLEDMAGRIQDDFVPKIQKEEKDISGRVTKVRSISLLA